MAAATAKATKAEHSSPNQEVLAGKTAELWG